MSRNRRETNERAGQRTLGNFISLGSQQRNRVEIIDDEDDEIEEINTQESSETAYGDRASRLRTRRQKRETAHEVQFSGDEEMNEEELQLQQVLLLSKMEADKQEERRKMCGTLKDVMNLQVEIEPLSPSSLKNLATETTRNATGDERGQREYTASPELFSTPPENQEGLLGIEAAENVESDTEFPNSPPLPVTMRSPDAVSNDEGGKEKPASTEPSLRQGKEDTRRKLKLRRTRWEEPSMTNSKEKNDDNEPKRTELEINEENLQSENSKVAENVVHGEKRKLEPDAADDITDDEDPIPALTRRISLKRKKLSVFLETSDSEDPQDVKKKGIKRASDKLSDPSPKSTVVSEHNQEIIEDQDTPPNGREPGAEARQQKSPPSPLRLSRKYKKSRCRPTTLKQAMKADLYFAPPGFDFPTYTKLIIRMMEKYKRRLKKAQSKVKMRLPWGSPVVSGNSPRHFEFRQPGKASIGGRSSAFVREMPWDATSTDVSSRKRTLRSSANQATASTSTATHETLPSYKVDSDSDNDEFMKSYLDKIIRPSVVTSSKKAKTATKDGGSFVGESATPHEPRAQAVREPSVKTQTSRISNTGHRDNGKTMKSKTQFDTSNTKIPARDGPGRSDMLFGAGVVLDSNSREIQSNVFDTSDHGKDESKFDSQTSPSKGSGLPKDDTHKDDVDPMDVDESQEDDIQPPKRRSILRSLDDDSTDDEGNLSQTVFPTKKASADCEVSSSKEEIDTELKTSTADVWDAVISDDIDSQSVMTQSESQGILGKSIIETMAMDGDTLLPSQALSEAELPSHKLITESVFTVEDSSKTASSSSVTKATAKRGVERSTVDVDSDDSQHARWKRSEVAERAAAAAERRQQQLTRGQETREASSSSSHVNSSVSQPEEESTVQCPLCYQCFTPKEIEIHASGCQGSPSPPQESYSQPQWEEAGAPSVSSSAPCAIYQTLSGERRQLKNMKVLLQRSPMAKKKLLEKNNQPTDSAKRNLDFDKNVKMAGSLDQYVRPLASSSRSFDQGSRKHARDTRAALRTESESERSGYERERDEEVYSWLDSASPEKKRPQQTYGGNTSKRCDDYIPLETPRQSEDEERGSKQTSSRTEQIESGSDTSDDNADALMVQYGAQRASRRRTTEPRKEEAQEVDENERALAQLGGRNKKRPLSLSTSSKPKRSRRRRDSDSEDSDESAIVCLICNKKIPKELYEEHVEQELEEKKRTGGDTRKVEVVTVKDRPRERSRGEQRRDKKRGKAYDDAPSQSSGTEHRETDKNDEEIDWDAVSDSPIKCFQLTENSSSGVDFENQFQHLKEKKGGRRRGNQERYEGSGNRRGYGQSDTRGGYAGSSNRGRFRGSYNKVYGRGRGKKYGGKSRGSRGRK